MVINTVQGLSKNAVETLIDETIPKSNVGMIVLEAKTNKVLFERRSQEPFVPASTMKLFTAAASLLSLGENHRFETRFQLQPDQLHQGELRGDLTLSFSGDPSLSSQDFRKMVVDLKKAGITEVQGDILIDDTHFEGPQLGPGWSADSLSWYYSAPISAVILDENHLPIELISNAIGKKANVKLKGHYPSIKLRSEITSVSLEEAKVCQIQVLRDKQNNLYLKGCWPQLAEPSTLKIALLDPNQLMEQQLLTLLKENNIRFSGQLKKSKAIKSLDTVVAHRSPPLKELLKKVLQESNNVYTESLTKTLGAKHFEQGTFKSGTMAMKEILSESTDIDFTTLRMEDGSGLSRYNAVTPAQFGQLLFALEHHPKVSTVFKQALPFTGGKDTTLNVRLKAKDLQKRIRAKTGSMTGVATLAGYLKTKNGTPLIFVTMVNNAVHDLKDIRSFEERLCRLLISDPY